MKFLTSEKAKHYLLYVCAVALQLGVVVALFALAAGLDLTKLVLA